MRLPPQGRCCGLASTCRIRTGSRETLSTCLSQGPGLSVKKWWDTSTRLGAQCGDSDDVVHNAILCVTGNRGELVLVNCQPAPLLGRGPRLFEERSRWLLVPDLHPGGSGFGS